MVISFASLRTLVQAQIQRLGGESEIRHRLWRCCDRGCLWLFDLFIYFPKIMLSIFVLFRGNLTSHLLCLWDILLRHENIPKYCS